MGSKIGTPIRYREDVGWEYRCESCALNGKASFWPLTSEFWDPRQGMLRCRSCIAAYNQDRRRAVEAAKSPEEKASYLAAKRIEYQRHRAAALILQREQYRQAMADPVRRERMRTLGRERNRRYRAQRKVA
jgi:hypothetical protein